MVLTAVSSFSDLVLSLRAGGHERRDLCLPMSSHPSLVKLPDVKAEDVAAGVVCLHLKDAPLAQGSQVTSSKQCEHAGVAVCVTVLRVCGAAVAGRTRTRRSRAVQPLSVQRGRLVAGHFPDSPRVSHY